MYNNETAKFIAETAQKTRVNFGNDPEGSRAFVMCMESEAFWTGALKEGVKRG